MDEKEFYDVRQDVAVLKAQRVENEKALLIATKALDHAQMQSNEWRGTVQDVINKCLTRDEVSSLLKVVMVEIDALKKANNRSAGKDSGIGSSWQVVVQIIGFLLLVAAMWMARTK
jgi:hypothetical protein